MSFKKRVKSNIKAIYVDFSRFHVFGHSTEDISGLCKWIFMKDSVLETLLVALYTINNNN